MRTRGEHDLTRPDVPQPALDDRLGRTLRDQNVLVIVVGESRGSREEANLLRRAQFPRHPVDPFDCRGIVDELPRSEERASRLALLVHQDHPGVRARGGDRGGESRWSSSHYQNVAVRVAFLEPGP